MESEWGKGATFIITLPIIAGESKREKEERKAPKRDLKGLKGLIIDDDPSIIEVVSKYLESQGGKIITARNVKVALNIIEREEFDFVICDMKIPEMDGSDFYRIVKEKWASLIDRIIFSTGDVLGDTTKVFIDSVPNSCIEKPFNLNELKDVIIKKVVKP